MIYIFLIEIKNFTGESHQVSTIYNLWKERYTEYKKSLSTRTVILKKLDRRHTEQHLQWGGEVICACVQT